MIGGMSWESTASYYRLLNEAVKHRVGGLTSAKLFLASVNFAEIAELQNAGKWDAMISKISGLAKDLEDARCDAIIICTNTMHKLYEPIQAAVNIPILHICDVIGRHAKAHDLKKLGLTGTKFTMEEAFYRAWLEKKYGLEVVIPGEAQRQEIHRIIFDNLCRGVVKADECVWFEAMNQGLLDQGCDAVILGCTELGMLTTQSGLQESLLDTTVLHAHAAVDFALSEG